MNTEYIVQILTKYNERPYPMDGQSFQINGQLVRIKGKHLTAGGMDLVFDGTRDFFKKLHKTGLLKSSKEAMSVMANMYDNMNKSKYN